MNEKSLVGKQLKLFLAPLGFAGKGVSWNRKGDHFVEIINFQVSSYGLDFTINIGVYDDEIHQIMWGHSPKFVQPTDSLIDIRAGSLVSHFDKWWDISADSVPEVISLISTAVFPFFEKIRDRRSAYEWMKTNFRRIDQFYNFTLQFAVLSKLIGEDGDYRKYLERGRRWKEHAERIERYFAERDESR